jgi:inositol phosphorylceramide synthase catalytic subunit
MRPTDFVKRVGYVLAICLAYLVFSYLLIGFKTDQLLLCCIFGTCYLASASTRKFIKGFSIFIVYWILFDYMKAFPNYEFNPVNIKNLYDAELRFFGFFHNGNLITPNQYWALNTLTWLDIACGLFYLCWIPVPLGFACYLYFKNREEFIRFSFTFFVTNILGFIIYYTYPAAPPWYPQQFGFEFYPNTQGQVAGLVRFDEFFNINIFKSIYAKGSNVFAAMPSLHSAYPVIVLYYGLRNKLGFLNLFLGLIVVGIWFAAVYTSHHYTLDVLAGILCAVVGIFLFNQFANKSPKVKRLLSRYIAIIS